MDNEMIYKMFLNTLGKMNESELENALKKARELLSEKDYQTLVNMIKQEKTNQ